MGHDKIANLFRRKWVVLLAWQVVSLVLCAAATVVTLIGSQFEHTIPFLMMAMIYLPIFLCSLVRIPRSSTSWWGYLVVAVLLIAGDYAGILSYEKTSMASALMFLTTGVFWVAPMSYCAFRRKLTIWQVFACFVAMGGGATIVAVEGTEGDNWVGDLLALASVIIYSVLAIAQEYLVNVESTRVYLFRFSTCALPFLAILTPAVESNLIRNYDWNWKSGLLMVTYGLLMALYDSLVPFILQYSDVTTMNLSLLSTNFFSLGISVAVFHQKASWLYIVGFLCIPLAIVIFSLTGPKPESQAPPLQLGREEEHEKRTYLVPLQPEASSQAF